MTLSTPLTIIFIIVGVLLIIALLIYIVGRRWR